MKRGIRLVVGDRARPCPLVVLGVQHRHTSETGYYVLHGMLVLPLLGLSDSCFFQADRWEHHI